MLGRTLRGATVPAVCLLLSACGSSMPGTTGDISSGRPQFVKVCETGGGRPACSTQHELVESVTGALLVSINVQQHGDKPAERITVSVPPGTLLNTGVLLTIDKNPPIKLNFTSCSATSCTAETAITPELLAQLRTGQRMQVFTINPGLNKAIAINVSLTGFGGVLDGPPMAYDQYVAIRRVNAPGAAIKIKTPEAPHNWHWDLSPQGHAPMLATWVKFCMRTAVPAANALPSVCLTHHEQIETAGVASVALRRVQGLPGEYMMVMVPIDMAIEPGVRVKLGGGEPLKLDYALCKGIGCIAQMQITPEMMKKLRNERSMTVAAIGMNGKTVRFQIPLNGFAKADDGPAMSLEAFRQARKTLVEMEIREMIQRNAGDKKQNTPPRSGPGSKNSPETL